MSADERLVALWEEIKDQIKMVEINLPLYRGLDALTPITLDGVKVVVGYPPERAGDVNSLHAAENQPVIQRVLGRVATKPLELELVEGTSLPDYERHRQLLAARAALRDRQAQQEPDWSEVAEGDEERAGDESASMMLMRFHRDLYHRYLKVQHKTFVTVRTQFLVDALVALVPVEQEVLDIEPDHEHRERQMSKALDRLAEMVQAEPIVVALEYSRIKQQLLED